MDAAEANGNGNGIACSGGMAATNPLCTEQFKNADLATLKVVPEAGYGFNGWIVDGAHMQMMSAEPLFLSTRPVLADNGSCAQVKNGSTNTQADCVLNALTLYCVDNGKAIPAKDKAIIGAYLSINRDDDNGDGQADNANTVIDDDEDRRDLAKITLKAAGQTETFTLNADVSDVVRLFDEAGTAKTLPVTVTPAKLASGLTYWVEGLSVGTVFVTVKSTSGTLEDQVKLVVGQEIGIKLTFDDGPDSRADTTTEPTVSRTQRLLNMLKNNSVMPNIKATFFVQTHCTSPYGGGVPKDAKHPMSGEELIKAIANDGHHVEVHTGNDEGHNSLYYHTERVNGPRYDADGDGDKDDADGANALDGDLIQAKARITSWTGRAPLLVRPPAGKIDSEGKVQSFYTKQLLQKQLWDVDTEDYTNSDSTVRENLSKTTYGGIPFWIRKGKTPLVILFHDVKENTVKNFESYLKIIENLVQHEGRNVRFERF